MRVQRLARAVDTAFARLQQARLNRTRFIRDYVGRYWLEDDGVVRPVNMINQAIRTMISPLAVSTPRATVSTSFPEMRADATLLKMALDHVAVENDDAAMTRLCLFDAMVFPFAVVASGIKTSDNIIKMGNDSIDPGATYAKRVSPDDIVIDPAARHQKECQFIGHRYRLSQEAAAQSGLFDPDRVMHLPTVPNASQSAGGSVGDRRAEDMSWVGGYGSDSVTLIPMIELVDVWLRDSNTVVTIPGDRGSETELLAQREYYGAPSPTGPYDILNFEPIPDNFCGAVPVGIWYDLALYTNTLARKMFAQIGRAKNLLLYQAGYENDALTAKNAADGSVIAVDNVQAFSQATMGGIDPQIGQFVSWLKQAWSEQTGNIDQLAGIKSAGNTATEAEILQNNMMARIRDMQDQLESWLSCIYHKRAFYLHHDPFIQLPMTKRLRNGIEIQVVYSDDTRSGDFWQYAIKVESGSTKRKSPDAQAQALIQFSTQIIPSLLQTFMATQGAFSLNAAVRLIAAKMGITEIDEIWNDPNHQQLMAQALMQTGQPSKAQPVQDQDQYRSEHIGYNGGSSGRNLQADPGMMLGREGGSMQQKPNAIGNMPAVA